VEKFCRTDRCSTPLKEGQWERGNARLDITGLTCGLYYKHFTFVIYDCNDIMIVIYDCNDIMIVISDCNDIMIVIYDCNDCGQYYKTMRLSEASLSYGRKLRS